MYCCICGDDEKLSETRRFWDPDDGWHFGRFCPACVRLAEIRPKLEDYAYARQNNYVVDGHSAWVDSRGHCHMTKRQFVVPGPR